MISSFFFTFSLLIFLSYPLSCHSIRCNPQDKQVLLKIKQHFNNPYYLASWNPQTDCCYWYVAKCDRKTNRITRLEFSPNDATISGQIPELVADLPYLEYLTFRKMPNLKGTIPSAITKLKYLKMLTVSWTNISGPIPSFLSDLKNLTDLDLSFNNLTGSIPPSLANLPNLYGLHLDRNKLTGSIPDSFGQFSPIFQYLYLSHNELTGMIPRSLGDLNLSVIDVQRNRLEGDISFLFGKNKTVELGFFSRNMLEFDMSKVEFPESLTSLDLNHNRVSGRLPVGLVDLRLQYLNVSYNRLCGEIPVGGDLQSMDYSCYFHNKCLCGAPLLTPCTKQQQG